MAYMQNNEYGGGVGGRFGGGITNPSFGGTKPAGYLGTATRQPSGRQSPINWQDVINRGRAAAGSKPWRGNWTEPKQSSTPRHSSGRSGETRRKSKDHL